MYKHKKILVIIPARGGSKGIPKKCIRDLGGRPLISYTIDAAKKSKYADAVVVSTDSLEIARTSKQLGADVPFLRPEKYATDSSPSSEAILHAIAWFEKKGESYDIVVLLEPTSPLRRAHDIDDAIKTFVDSYDKADALVSLGEIHLESPYIAKIIESGYVQPLLPARAYYRRQQLLKTYFPYGVIYISKVSKYKKTKTFYQKRTIPYLIERWQNYEIDDMVDLQCVELILERNEQKIEKNIEIKGHKTLLQLFTTKNLHDPNYYRWLGDKEVVRTIGRSEYLKPIEFSSIEQYVRTLMESDHDDFFALYTKVNKKFIGTVKIGSIDRYNGTADVGIMIGDKHYWGKGLATDAVSAVCRYAFETLKLRKLTGGCFITNIAMVKCFEKLGFVREGLRRKQNFLDGVYVDHVIYGLLKEDYV